MKIASQWHRVDARVQTITETMHELPALDHGPKQRGLHELARTARHLAVEAETLAEAIAHDRDVQ